MSMSQIRWLMCRITTRRLRIRCKTTVALACLSLRCRVSQRLSKVKKLIRGVPPLQPQLVWSIISISIQISIWQLPQAKKQQVKVTIKGEIPHRGLLLRKHRMCQRGVGSLFLRSAAIRNILIRKVELVLAKGNLSLRQQELQQGQRMITAQVSRCLRTRCGAS